MTGVKKVSAANNTVPDDLGLNELFRYIKASLGDDNNRKRMIYTDKQYHFTVQSESDSGMIERQVVWIPAGQPLYLLRHDHSDETNTDQFMVNVDDHGWRINGATGAVRYFSNPIYVVGAKDHTMPIAGVKYNGNGLSLR